MLLVRLICHDKLTALHAACLLDAQQHTFKTVHGGLHMNRSVLH